MTEPFDVVTGAFGQTGNEIAARLLASGRAVRALTRAPAALGEAAGVPVIAPTFDDPPRLTAALRGCEVLYSAYWSRFAHHGSYAVYAENARRLFACAREAGVARIVQVSVAHAERRLPDPYWQGKARLEEALRACEVPHSLVRPALIYGPRDTLVNNLAWTLRRLPVFAVPGRGRYRIRPVFVGDLAGLCAAHGRRRGNQAVDAIGPEAFPFVEFVRRIRDAVGSRAGIVPLPAAAVWLGAKTLAPWVRDTLLTWSEIRGLRSGWFDVDGPATCATSFTDWLARHADSLGASFHSQRRRHLAQEYPGRLPPR